MSESDLKNESPRLFGGIGIADLQQVRYVVEGVMKKQTYMQEEFDNMLYIMERNRVEDSKRIVSPEFLQDKI